MKTKNNWLFLEQPQKDGFHIPASGVSQGVVVHGSEEYVGKTVLYWIEPKKYNNLQAIQEKDVMAVL